MINSILNLFRRDVGIKVVMLLVALGLWAYVAISQAQSGNFPGALKIKVKNTPSGTTISLNENYAELKIEGDRSLWARLQPNSFDVYVDASNLTPGTHEMEVQASSLVSNVKIVSITPRIVLATVESISSLELPITVKVEGKSADNFVIGEKSAVPSRVVVSAPSDILLDDITVSARVVLDGESQSFTKKVQLEVLDKKGQVLSSSKVEITPQEVSVKVEIVPSGQSKTVGVKPVTAGNVEGGYYVKAISVTPSTVDVEGPPDTIGGITYLSTEQINIEGLTLDKTFTANLVVPSSVSATPKQVQVQVSVGQNSTQ